MVELRNVSKIYKGYTILDDITYTFEKGKIYGIYGKNGSGKTLLLKLIAGLVFPSSGTICFDNKILHKDISFPDSMGIIIENMQLLPNLNAYENLYELSRIKKVASKEDIQSAISRIGLDSDLCVKKYSLGMKQKLNIAQAIFENPNLILLDEPTNALDDDAIERLKNIIREEKEAGKCILIATHSKEDIGGICDEILSIKDGRIHE